jgi:hypothetical protein
VIQQLTDQDFAKFLTDGYYAVVGFYHPGAANKDEMMDVLEQFDGIHASAAVGTLDITGSTVADDYGVDEDISPVIVVFKQQNPIKVMTEFDFDELNSTITPPGKNITLQ